MKKIFETVNLNKIQMKNRIIRSGTWMRKATEDGYLTPELISEYTKLAEANLGMVVVGYARVNQFEKANNKMIGLYDDKFIQPLQEFTQIFHENNTPVGIQIAMGGTQIHYQGEVTWDVMSPIATTITRKDDEGNKIEIEVPEMSKKDIENTIDDFVAAAIRVKKAGFDMVQLHAGHGYFISQWMNPAINTRTDEYGQKPSKYIIDLYQAVRSAVGDEFPIAIKINSEERIGDDSNHQAMLDLCQSLSNLGIDMIEVSGFAPSRNKVSLENESYFQEFASKLKKIVDCPVMLTGGNKTFANMETVINTTDIDFIGMSRPLISEPDLVTKWSANSDYQTRCISCNHCHRKVYQCVFDK